MKIYDTADSLESSPDINITPFVDVLLVLIVILMVAIPASFTNIDVSVPKKKNDEISLTKNDFVIQIEKEKKIIFNGKTTNVDRIIQELKRSRVNKNKKIYIASDQNNLYKDVVEVLDILIKNGYINTVLITEKK